MRYPSGHKPQKRKDLLQASGALIKAGGFAATGIDAMAQAAGVTSGAFYSHFGSKGDLLKALIERELQHSTEMWAGKLDQSLAQWLDYVMRHYLSLDHVQHPESGCVLPALGAEIARSDTAVKEVFAHELQKGINGLAERLGDPQLATAVISQMVAGGQQNAAEAASGATVAVRLTESHACRYTAPARNAVLHTHHRQVV